MMALFGSIKQGTAVTALGKKSKLVESQLKDCPQTTEDPMCHRKPYVEYF